MDFAQTGIASQAGMTGITGTFALGVFFIALVYARLRWKTRLTAMTRRQRDAERIFVNTFLLSNLSLAAGSWIALSLAYVGTFATLLVVMAAFAVFATGNILILIEFRRDLVRAGAP
jgi:hypothetical protein